MTRLQDHYKKEVVPKMKELFNYKNDLAVPRLKSVSINIGLGDAIKKKDSKIIDVAKETIVKITGQKPVETKAKISIAGFKIRKGLVVGLKTTLRKNKMYDFVDKLINISIPRTRDFRGLKPSSVDQNGNFSLGIREQLIFPEISSQSVEKIHGLEITITTTAQNKERGLTLLKLLGLPFKPTNY